MRIGLISDTHIPSYGKEPPHQVIEAFKGVDLILHAGDIYTESCIEWLGQIAPVQSAKTWMSSGAEGAPRTGSVHVIQAEGHSIGLVHKLELLPMPEEVFPGRIAKAYPAGKSLPAELEVVFGQPVDIVVCGYTHEAMVERHQGVLFVNPGSTSMVKQVVKLGSVAVLELTPDSAEARVIDLTTLPA
ncbi:MAG: metallophosphoesterase family protein [Chloroflexi bacterium]|nr:metallophosphoesterase family protein [Chloroflexota bacterium]MQC28178.1 metallophosphoesterase [Chloroflexota bacterium]